MKQISISFIVYGRFTITTKHRKSTLSTVTTDIKAVEAYRAPDGRGNIHFTKRQASVELYNYIMRAHQMPTATVK